MRSLLYIVFCSLGLTVSAQWSNLQSNKLKLNKGDVYLIDSGIIAINSVSITGFTGGLDYEVDSNKIVWLASNMKDSTIITYRLLYFSLNYYRKDPKLIQQIYEENPFDYIPPSEREADEYSKLNTYGNISRGIGFGNAQDIVVNSNLNLRINGLLPNGVDVVGVISDENNPIQPEGNTQQIQDFDQVYIQLSKDSTKLTVGDFLMQRQSESYFINYYKKSRGLQFDKIAKVGDWKTQIGVEAAISRGRFSRNQIQGIDGNLGPYRLSGSNGEIFIILIAGTEKVYLDGALLTRGENNDYVINYNTGELSFTPKILITRYSRIVVEFQYSDRNYARSVFRTGGSVAKGNWKIYANYFNEMDLKNQPFQLDLDATDSLSGLNAREILSISGDSSPSFSNVSPGLFNSERIMYRQKDSLGIKVYVYTDDASSDSVFYEVQFSHVGLGNGSYQQIQSSANGKVFEFVGIGNGDYEPISVLIPPKRLNMWNLGFVRLNENSSSGVELSLSDQDLNTFSNQDDKDNRGYGLKVFRKGKKFISDSSWTLEHKLNYELISQGFNYVERYRNVEFNRQWNKVLNNPGILDQINQSMEHVVNAGLRIEKSKSSYVETQFSSFIRPENYSGLDGSLRMNYQLKKTQFGLNANVQESESKMINTISLNNGFYGFDGFLEQEIFNTVIGLKAKTESSSFSQGTSDSLQAQSYAMRSLGVYAKGGGQSFTYAIEADQRDDELPKNGDFNLATVGKNLRGTIALQSSNNNKLSLITSYRNLAIKDSSLAQNTLENSIQSRLDLDLNLLKRFIRSKSFVQIGSGQEQRREFQYLQVQSGNGMYIWNDYDSNGVQSLNEFEIASDLDKNRADYIRIFTPVPGFITTRTTKFSESFELNPAALIKSKKGFGSFIARFNSNTALLYEQKTLPQSRLNFNELGSISDTALLNRSSNLRTTLFFNRSNSRFGMDYSYKSLESKILLTNGFDIRATKEQQYNIRWNIVRQWTLRSGITAGTKSYTSEFFSLRNYDYEYLELKPKLQFQLSNTFRAEAYTSFFSASNTAALGGETTRNVEIGTSIKFTQASQTSLLAEMAFVRVDYTGETGSTLGYELLRGLQNGQNATWRLNYQRKIAGSIQLVLSYDGRKSEGADAIHIGRLLARYLF
ncbi:MAG: hypothetical protein JXR19_01935 [Bacteroidia bacterium]